MIPWLNEHDISFPDIHSALNEPNGLLAAGGDLSVNRLICAYQQGIFPWYSDDDPILWWSPAPRCVIYPDQLHISKSLRKTLKKQNFKVTFDRAFTEVIAACSAMRKDSEGTWISDDIQRAYCQLHTQGVAHSVEVWNADQLIGGLYGIALGKVFFGESMFSRQSNGSKIAFCYLVAQLKRWNFTLIDCQVHNDHLESLGAIEISRDQFQQHLQQYDLNETPHSGAWQHIDTEILHPLIQ